jgi:SAM-dependent methyltransferase
LTRVTIAPSPWAGEITSPVLDSRCGTGEHALMLAEHGMDVLGIDVAPTAIGRARSKARERKLSAEFEVGDVLALDRLGRTFATVIDSGLFHIFDDTDRPVTRQAWPRCSNRAECSTSSASLSARRERGPQRVTQAELHAIFAHGWEVMRIESARIGLKEDYQDESPTPCWRGSSACRRAEQGRRRQQFRRTRATRTAS